MAIRNWHVGKIALLWIWAVVLLGIAVNVLEKISSPVLGSFLMIVMLALPIGLSVITWKWLGGKER